MADTVQHTLYLWPQGFFPRRIVYYLLIKGLTSSVDLPQGKSAIPSLKISLINFNAESQKLEPVDPSDPKPADKSTPCLRIIDPSKGTTHWIHESTSIPSYLEDAYPDFPPLQSKDIVEKGILSDIILAINCALDDFTYYLRHASPIACKFTGLPNEDRNHKAALNGKAQMNKGLLKMQTWAGESLRETGWLTPGIKTPGLADVCLAGWVRYIELTYEFDVLEGEGLDELRGWWARFKGLPWWKDVEETGEIHPPSLRFGKASREV